MILQAYVRDWSQKLINDQENLEGGYTIDVKPEIVALHIIEEAMELCVELGASPEMTIVAAAEAFGKLQKQINDREHVPEGPKKEIGDLLLIACRIANSQGFDLEQAGEERLVDRKQQKWRVTRDGDFRRIKR